MLKVYFQQRPLHRKRQRETVEFCPDGIEKLTPPHVTFAKDTDIMKNHLALSGKMRAKILHLLPLHIRPVKDPTAQQADVIFTWGSFPFDVNRPYVIELDTPYVLTHYSLFWFALMKPILKRLILSPRCRRLVCISEACRETLRQELGDKVAAKADVVYPYMADYTNREKRPEAEKVNFLFVSRASHFYLKGGKETLNAFARLAETHPNAHLYVISDTPPEIQEKYGDAPWVTFVEANLAKDELFRKYYDTCDVFVSPTYMDSFGIVFLEAVAFGMPVVSTRVYAVPEMIENGKNGFLVEPPFLYYQEDKRALVKNWSKEAIDSQARSGNFPDVENALYDAMSQLMDSRTREAMSEHSQQLYRQKFQKSIRDAAFLRVFREDVPEPKPSALSASPHT